jgi:FkbM family methyltransferase
MLISLQEILSRYNLKPKGVIHVGAHWAEEHDDYTKRGIERFVYVEPCKNAYDKIIEKILSYYGGLIYCMNGEKIPFDKEYNFQPRDEDGWYVNEHFYGLRIKETKIIRCACGSEEGEMPMYVSHQNQGQSNSLLEPDLHLQQHPEVVFDDAEMVKVVTLDSLPIEKDKYDMLVMDVQGFEGEVLKGATETLKHIDIIYTEVNRGQTYSGNMEIDEMDLFLAGHGFKRVETYWPSPSWTWGDACFVRI